MEVQKNKEKHRVCLRRKLLDPDEKDCKRYEEVEDEKLPENNCLCNNCIELEVWKSRQHDLKHKVCFIKKLLNPTEKECKNHKRVEKPLSSNSSLCQSCVNLETWHSKLYERKIKDDSIFDIRNMELCPVRHILSPSEINCGEYIMIGSQNNNSLCRSCTNLTLWQSKYKTLQAGACEIRHRILPLKHECEYYKSSGK